MGRLDPGLPGGGAVTMTDPHAVGGEGWTALAKQIDVKAGKVQAEGPLAGLMRTKTLTGGTDPAGFDPVRAPLAALGADTRYVYPHLNRAPLSPQNVSVTEWRQTGTRAITGTVERATPFVTTDKAELGLTIEHVSETVRQLAVLISDVPNQVLEEATLAAWLRAEGQQAIDVALDVHVGAQIDAEEVPYGGDGANLVEQVRYGVAAMRSAGANPTLLAVHPDDAVALDLFTVGADGLYLFGVRAEGSASPLHGLTIVETPTVIAPTLIDPAMLGVLYAGQAKIEADPYSSFEKNTTRLRIEVNALFHVRDANGAFKVEEAS